MNARTIAKFFLYLAPLSILIVASSMFFPFIVGKAIFFRVVVALSAMAYAAHLLFFSSTEEMRDAKEVARNPLFLSILAFTIFFLIACAFATNPQIAFWSNFERGEGGLQMIFYAIFFMLLTLILRTKKEWLNYLFYLIPIGIMVSLYAIGQRMNYLYIQGLKTAATAAGSNINQALLQSNPWNGFFGDGSRISGTLGNPLYISTFIIFIFFFISILFLEKIQSKAGKVALGIIAAFEVVVFSMADSRNGLAGILGGIIAFLILMVIRAKDRRVFNKISVRNFALSILALFAILGGIFYMTRTTTICGSYQAPSGLTSACSTIAHAWTKVPIVDRFAKDRILSGLDDRIWTWGSAISGVIEKPVLGWGPENFPVVFDRYYNANHFGGDSWFDRAHDTLLEYLVGGGMVLLLAYLAVWFFYFREIYKKRKAMSLPILGLMTGFPIAYLIQGISAFEVLPIFLMLYIFFALNIRLHSETGETGEKSQRKAVERYVPSQKATGLVQAGVMGVIFILAMLSFYYADYLPFSKNRQLLLVASASKSENPQLVYQKFLETLSYSSPVGQQETVQYFLLFIYHYLDDNSKNQQLATKKSELLGLVAQANEIYKKNEESPNKAVGVKSLSYIGLIHFKAAVILQNRDLLDSSQKLLEQGLLIAPSRFEFIYPLLDIAVIKGDKTMALPLLARAKSLRPDIPRNAQYEQALSNLATPTSTSSTLSKPN